MHTYALPFAFATLASVSTLLPSRAALASPTEPSTTPTFGAGYKLGNGVGFQGLDLIVEPIPHLSIELQASLLSDFESGYAVIPSVVGSWKRTGSTPYVKAGAIYASVKDEDVSVSGTGFLANVGYEWKLRSGLGIQLGLGVLYLQEVTGVSGDAVVTLGGDVGANLEFGLRYRF